MMLVYRVAKCTFIRDLSGQGAFLYGGRWNSKGISMLYTSITASLALLENRVHMTAFPKEEYCLATLTIPDDKLTTMETKDLPNDWNKYPAPVYLKSIGDSFIKDGHFLGLLIPSSVLPEEKNVLLNPSHSDMKKVKLTTSRPIPIDIRLFK